MVSLYGVCKHAQSRGVLGHAPPGKFINLQPLRLFLVAPETTYTVWFVSSGGGGKQYVGEGGSHGSPPLNKSLRLLWTLTDPTGTINNRTPSITHVTRYGKTTTRKKVWFYSGGSILDSTFFFPFFFSFDIPKVWSFAYPFVKVHHDTRLFSVCTAREKEWRSVLAGYVNGLTVLSINKNLQAAVDLHDDTRA